MKCRFQMVLALVFMMSISLTILGRKPEEKKHKRPAPKIEKSLDRLYLESLARFDGKDAVFYIDGYAYAFIPGQRPRRLFGMEGYNIRRWIETPEKDGYFMASREVVFYTDPKTGEVIWEWNNPFTGKKNEVFHIANDPVNFRMRVQNGKTVSVSLNGKRTYGKVTPPQEWEDYYVWHSDVFPFYPLPGWEKNYTAAELFDFYVPKADRYRQGPPSVMNSWTRVGPWLPWMRMDGHDGVMIYHARSKRFESWDQLPARIKKLVKERYPKYMSAPSAVDPNRRNATSWTVYMKEMKRRREGEAGAR